MYKVINNNNNNNNQYGLHLQSDLIRSQSGDLNPGMPGTKQLLCHVSYHPLTSLILFIWL